MKKNNNKNNFSKVLLAVGLINTVNFGIFVYGIDDQINVVKQNYNQSFISTETYQKEIKELTDRQIFGDVLLIISFLTVVASGKTLVDENQKS